LQHSSGIIIVYVNHSQKTLVETLDFKIEGLAIKGHEGPKVEIRVAPGETKDVQLETTGGGYSFGMGISYFLE
jgi:hypothetical protein